MKIIEKSKVVDIGLVKNWDKNARGIKDADLARLKKQIVDIGVYKPLLCEVSGDGYVTLGGNMRLRALKELNAREVWITIIEVTDDAERMKVSLSDNDRAGYYIEEELARNLAGLNIDLKDYCVDVKVPDINLQDILDRATAASEDADEVPEVRESSIRVGDIYKLGNHRVMCGDSAKAEDVGRLMDGKKVDMVFTDPPYGVSYADKNKYLNSISRGNRIQEPIKNDHLSLEKIQNDLIYPAFCLLNKFLNEDGSYYITAPQGGDLLMMMMMMEKSGLKLRHMIIWVKNNHVLGRSDYNYKHEPILYGWKEKHNFYGNGKHLFSAWQINKPLKSDLHPTMKPVELVVNALLNSTKESDYVLDLFLGSGTTLIACEETKRKCYGMELDPMYVQVIIDRWEKQTGQKAEKC